MLIRNGVYSRFDFRPRALLPPHLRAWKAGASAIKERGEEKFGMGVDIGEHRAEFFEFASTVFRHEQQGWIV